MVKSFWKWTFNSKWYYIILGIWFFLNNSFWNFINGKNSLAELIGNILGLGIILSILFFIAYKIYLSGYKKATK